MNQPAVIFGSLSLTMLLLGIALAVAWAGFGRRRHAADWATAFLLMAVAYAALVLRWCAPETRVAMASIASPCSIVCAALIAIGFRRRAGLGDGRRLRLAAALVALGAIVIEILYPANASHRFVVNGFYTAMLLIAARAVRRGGASGVHRAAFWLLIYNTGVRAALTVLGFMTAPNGAFPEEVYRLLYLLGAPSGLIGIGLSAMLLIGADLADELRRLAAFDPLTGVLNRRGIEAAAAQMLARNRRIARPMALVIADLDRFKSVNDRFGHATGDAVLQCFARHCAATVRDGDVVGRLGGEEFLILMPDASARVAAEAMERLRAGLAAALEATALPASVTASFGVAGLLGGGDTLAAMLARADAALYGSKGDGRDRITFATDATPPRPDRRFAASFARAS